MPPDGNYPSPMPRTLNIALIPGDGIGTEVVAEAVKVLSAIAPAADLDVRTTEYDLGARRYNATGELLPDAVVEELRGYDAILLGAIGDPVRRTRHPRARRAAAAALRHGPPREPAAR